MTQPNNNSVVKPVTSKGGTDAHHVFINYAPRPGGDYFVHLDQAIREQHNYRDLVQFMENAGENDTFHLYLDGPGGYLSTCVNLIHTIGNTKAKVIGYLKGEVNSAHSNIFMACHEHVVYPYSLMMVHTFSGGTYGKGHDITRSAEAYNALTRTSYTDLYAGFLSEKEIEDVLENNKDLYFIGEDIADRLENTYKVRQELADKEAEAANAAMQEALQSLTGNDENDGEQLQQDEQE